MLNLNTCMISNFLLLVPSLCFGNHENHNKPFGTGLSEPVDIHNGFLNPITFWQKYVSKNKPLLMRQAAKMFPAMKNWNDEYFLGLNLSNYTKQTIFVEKQKKEDRSLGASEINFKEFIRSYNQSNYYMVDSIPKFLNQDIIMPWSLQCRVFDENIYQVLMWFSSGGTSSVVHTDDMENINCLIRGEKIFILVDPVKHKDKIPLRKNGAYSDIDVDKVDFNMYPQMSSVDFMTAKMVAGDCLYVPRLWIHQVRSFNRNIAINVWFRIPADTLMTMNESQLEKNCNAHEDVQKTFHDTKVLGLDDIVYYKNDALDKLSDFENKSLESIVQTILELYSDVDNYIISKSYSHIRSVIKDIIDEIDTNSNSIIDSGEIEETTKENLERISNYVNYLKTYLVSLAIKDDDGKSQDDRGLEGIHHSEL